jgi:hypothetical protein
MMFHDNPPHPETSLSVDADQDVFAGTGLLSKPFQGLASVAYGTPGRIRTCYPRLRRPMLYPNELRAQ